MHDSYIQSFHGPIYFEVPSSWNVLTVADFQDPPNRPDPAARLTRAMENPVDAPALEHQITPGNTISVLVEDLTRKSPKKIIVKKLLERLTAFGIRSQDISVVIALGTHQPLSTNELEGAFGKETVAAYSFSNHDCRADDLVPVGRPASGATVKINSLTTKAHRL